MFVDTVARVRAPASSANLGPGFDALGLAVQLHDDVSAAVAREGLSIEVRGEGGTVPRDEAHLVVRAMRATFERLGGQPPGIALVCHNRIPHGRGLGSSAAAIVSGVLLARALVRGGQAKLDDDAAFQLIARLEGHPDNVAACLYGGFTVAWRDGETARARRLPVTDRLRLVLMIPPFEASTAEGRALLPAAVPHADAAFAAGRSALLTAVLTGAVRSDAVTLLAATDDRLHQPHRAPAMPATAELVRRLRAEGHAAVVSGAGPTVLVLQSEEPGESHAQVETLRALASPGWRVEALEVDRSGATVRETDSLVKGTEPDETDRTLRTSS